MELLTNILHKRVVSLATYNYKIFGDEYMTNCADNRGQWHSMQTHIGVHGGKKRIRLHQIIFFKQSFVVRYDVVHFMSPCAIVTCL